MLLGHFRGSSQRQLRTVVWTLTEDSLNSQRKTLFITSMCIVTATPLPLILPTWVPTGLSARKSTPPRQARWQRMASWIERAWVVQQRLTPGGTQQITFHLSRQPRQTKMAPCRRLLTRWWHGLSTISTRRRTTRGCPSTRAPTIKPWTTAPVSLTTSSRTSRMSARPLWLSGCSTKMSLTWRRESASTRT